LNAASVSCRSRPGDHADADLTDAERQLLVDALEGMGGGGRGGRG
jgi:hypothetical protein